MIAGGTAIVGGLVLHKNKEIDLKKSWSLKASKISASTLTPAAREYQKFKLGLGLGYVGPKLNQGTAFYLEPMFRIADNFATGVRFEWVSGTQIINSISLNSQYYLNKNKLRPFVGGGIGSYVLSPASISGRAFGFYPRIGFDYSQFNVTLDYNIVAAQDVFVGNGGYQVKPSYFALKVGVCLGGGRK